MRPLNFSRALRGLLFRPLLLLALNFILALLLFLIVALLVSSGRGRSYLTLLLLLPLNIVLTLLLLLLLSLDLVWTLLLLLIIALVITAGWRRALFRALIFTPLVFVPADIFRTPFLLNYLTYRACRESLASGALDGFHPGAAIFKDRPPSAIKVNRLALKISNHAGAIND